MIKLNKIILILISILIVSSCAQQKSAEEYIQSGQKMLTDRQWRAAIIEFKNAVKQSPDNAKARALLGEVYVRAYSSDAAVKEINRAIELGYEKNAVLLLLGKAYQQKNEFDKIITEIQVDDSQSPEIKAELYALRASAFLALNDINKAKSELDSARSLNEDNTEVRLAWAKYAKRNSDSVAERKWLEPLIETGKDVPDAWSMMAELAQKENNLDVAETNFTKAIELRGVVHLDMLKRALVRIAKKNYDGALNDVNTLKKAGAQWPMVGYAEGLISYSQNNFDSAQSLFEKVLSQYPDYLPARLLIGLTHFNKGNYQNTISNLEFYLASFPDAFQANYIYATALLKLGKSTEAIQLLQKLEKAEPDNYQVLSLLGVAYLTNKQQGKSIQVLNKAVALDPAQARTRLQLGTVLLQENAGLEEAQQQLIKAIELDPELFQADYALYMSYMRSKKYEQAGKVAKALKLKQKDNTLGANLVALSYLAAGNKQKAIDELTGELKLVPSDPTTSNNLARIYLQDNQVAKAKDLYLNVLEKNPADLNTINQLALMAAKENDSEKSMEWLKKAVERNPDELSAKLLLANQYLRHNTPELAVQLLRNVEAEDKELPGYILLMAKSKMGIGEYEHATASLKSLVTRQPELSSAHFLLAQSYAYQNDQLNMRESLESTVKLNPEHFSANLMLARLDLLERKSDSFKQRVAMLVKMYPDSKDVQLLNAKVQSSEKSYDSAIKTLTSLMSESPRSEVVIDLVKNQWNSGDKDSAISNLELWLQDNKEDKNALMLLSQFYLGESRTVEAKNTYQELDKLLPNNSVVLNNLAWLMLETDVKQGVIYAEKALSIEPDSPFIEDTLAMLLLKNGDNAKALVHSQSAAKKLPNVIDVQLNYAKVLSANNQKDEARSILKNLLKNTSSYEKRKEISNELNRL